MAEPDRPVPVLLYHSVSDGDRSREIAPYTVGPATFRAHLDLVEDHGCTVVSVDHYADVLAGRRPLPPRPVVLTFDDGFADVLDVAAPALHDRHMPAMVYVTTGQLVGSPRPAPERTLGPMLDWSTLGELESAGIAIGAHSHSHPQLDLLSRAAAVDEVKLSQRLLEDALGHPVSSFAYPHGYATPTLRRDVQDLGFASACGVRNRFSGVHDHPYLIARLTVRADTPLRMIASWIEGRGARGSSGGGGVRSFGWRTVRRVRAAPHSTATRAS